MQNLKVKWFFVLSYATFIWILSSFPVHAPKILDKITFADKIIHIILFGIMAFFVFFLVKHYIKKVTFVFFTTIIITTLYGIIDEIHQYFVPGRTSSVMDAAADFVGAVIVSFFLLKREE